MIYIRRQLQIPEIQMHRKLFARFDKQVALSLLLSCCSCAIQLIIPQVEVDSSGGLHLSTRMWRHQSQLINYAKQSVQTDRISPIGEREFE